MKKIIIIGTGGQSKVVSDEISILKEYKTIGYIDEFKKIGTRPNNINNAKILGKINDLKKIYKKNLYLFLAIGDNYKRKKIVKQILDIGINPKWATIISKNSIVSKFAKISQGSIIVKGSIINTSTIIGEHCIINTGSKIDHDNYFYSFTSCGPNVTTGGNVKLKTFSHIGIDSTVKQNILISKNTIIGAKSYVNKNCLKNCIYYGVPIKKIRERKIGEKYL